MKHKRALLRMVAVTIFSLVLVACNTPPSTTPQIPPTNTPTQIRPTVTATATRQIPPTSTPTAIRPTNTPTQIRPTATAIVTRVDGTWTTRANMPTERWEHYTCAVDGRIYVIGGAGPFYEALRTVEVYDPATDAWTAKSDMPTARQGLSVSVVNGKIYAIGGGVSSSSSYYGVATSSAVEEYDPKTDTWITKSPMPTARGWHSANVADGKIYIFGGSQNSAPSGGHVLAVEVYDPVTDTWSQKNDMPSARGAGSGSVVDGKIYFFGGYGMEWIDEYNPATDIWIRRLRTTLDARRVDEYDPDTDTWMVKSEMPLTRIGLSTTVLDGKIYLIGGFKSGDGSYIGVTAVEVYDPATDTWATAPDMPTGRFGAYTSVVDGKIYVLGGIGHWPSFAIGTVEVFEPEKD